MVKADSMSSSVSASTVCTQSGSTRPPSDITIGLEPGGSLDVSNDFPGQTNPDGGHGVGALLPVGA